MEAKVVKILILRNPSSISLRSLFLEGCVALSESVEIHIDRQVAINSRVL